MKVMTLFNEYRASNNNNVLNQDGIVNYYGKILPSEEANQYFDLLMRNIQWKNDDLVLFGKHAWYGDSEQARKAQEALVKVLSTEEEKLAAVKVGALLERFPDTQQPHTVTLQ
jgi:hypothetical protein